MSEFDCDEHKEDKDEIWACLSCYDEGVARRERERIIKLLESDNWLMLCRKGKACKDKDNLGYCDCKSLRKAIKGEQK